MLRSPDAFVEIVTFSPNGFVLPIAPISASA
jgi:hypothetical protein